MKCQCNTPDDARPCATHGRTMPEAFWNLCHNGDGQISGDAYFDSFAKPRSPTKKRHRGLGDVVAKIAGALGFKKCGGCKKRQKKLNQMFPFRSEQ